MKVQQGSATIKMIARECRNQKYCHNQKSIKKCNNQKYFKEVSQSKVLPGSAEIMGPVRQYHKKLHTESATKVYKRVSQSKVLPEKSTEIPRSVTIKSTARDHHNQKYCQGRHNQKHCQGVPY